MKQWAMPRRRVAGLTLIELSVALAIFAVLGLLSYRALNNAADSETRLGEGVRRWEALARALGRVESEVSGIVVPIADARKQEAALMLQAGEDSSNGELSFLRLDEARGVRRVGFRLHGQKLEWLLWEGRERVGTPQVEVLLDGVSTLHWRFIAPGQNLNSASSELPRERGLPAGLAIELALSDLGRFQRLFALR
jgi:general secretion pathway protein J